MKALIATGGTGGHIFPAVQTALEMRKRGHTVVMAGVLGMAQADIEAQGFACQTIDSRGLTDRSPAGLLRFGTSISRGFAQSLKIIHQVKPDKVIGFGGYGAFPLVLAAAAQGIPTMIHEQNVVPGKANQVLAVLVKRIALSFKDSLKHVNAAKAVWTGCPCHHQASLHGREDILKDFGLTPGAGPVVALLGGSQGSQRLNALFFAAVHALAGQQPLQVIHMTGKKEYDAYVEKYRGASFPVAVRPFIRPIEDLYAVVDCLVSRAGAATVCELGVHGVPAVMVPYPFAGGHQVPNAEVLSRAGAAVLREEKDLTPALLAQAVQEQLLSGLSRAAIKEKTRGLFTELAAANVADALERL